MPDLFDRLFPEDIRDDNISIHTFAAVLIDYIRGYTTRQQIIGAWELDADAQSDLNTLCDSLDGMSLQEKLIFAVEIDAVMLIANSGLKYATKQEFAQRLGIGG